MHQTKHLMKSTVLWSALFVRALRTLSSQNGTEKHQATAELRKQAGKSHEIPEIFREKRKKYKRAHFSTTS